MHTDKTPEDHPAQPRANELDEGQLDEVAGGLAAVQLTAEADGSVRIVQPVSFNFKVIDPLNV
jgi:hypothetical protein